MKLKYFFGSILAAASLAVLPEIGLAHGGGGGGGAGGGGHGFGGGGGGHDFLLVAFPVAEIKVVLATVVSVDASATFAGVVFARLMEAFSISASMGMDIRIITRTTTRITIRILIRTTTGPLRRTRWFVPVLISSPRPVWASFAGV